MTSRCWSVCFTAIAGIFLAGAQLSGQENLLYNPGFEKSKPVNIRKDAPAPWGDLVQRGIEIEQGDAVRMPVGWEPTSWGGWSKGSFMYVAGQEGREVHRGTRAICIQTKTGAYVVSKVGFSVAGEEEGLEGKRVLPLKKPFSFSFFGKGDGKVSCYLCTYLVERESYSAEKVTPAEFNMTGEWKKYEGIIEFTDPDVIGAFFVIVASSGTVTVDDVALYNSPVSKTP